MENGINLSLIVLNGCNDNLTTPQKCILPKCSVDFPVGSVILVNKTFLAKYFQLDEIYGSLSCFVDDCVVITESVNYLSPLRNVQEVQLIKDTVDFSFVKVELHIDPQKLDLRIIRNKKDLISLAHSILKNYIISKNALVSCNNQFGISKIFVKETQPAFGYGTILKGSKVEVIEFLFGSNQLKRAPVLGGLDNAFNQINELITLNKAYKADISAFQIRPVCQALLIGPSGVGKSTVIRNVVEKAACNLIEVNGEEVFKPYPGETEFELEKIFTRTKDISKLMDTNLTIILIENIDLFCPKANHKIKDYSHSYRIASKLISLLDDITLNTSGILVLATTSKIESLSTSLRQSKRFGCEIVFEMPDEKQRQEILQILMKNLVKNTEISTRLSQEVAQKTPGYVGADLELLCQFVSRQVMNRKLDIEDLKETAFYELFALALKSILPSVLRDNVGSVTRSSLKLNSIGGMNELKKSLLTCILGPLRNPEVFDRFGIQSPKGILLYGPSGCAKTTITKCLAGETQMTLISVSSAEIYSPYVGEAEKFIVKLFNQARMSAPAILFFDEIDTIVGNRSKGGSTDVNTRILSTLLTEIDGFGGSQGNQKAILVIGATNRPDLIDDALMRPGRFDKLIHVPAPDYQSRICILKHIAERMPILDDVKLQDVAVKTNNFSGADLVNLCNEAALNAATKDLNASKISKEDFDDVLAYLQPSLSEKQIMFYYNYERQHRAN